MNIILSIIIAVATLFAPALPSQPTQPTLTASQPSTTATLPDALTVHCEEDQPCWNCQTMGNRICGPTSEQYANEAESLLNAQPINPDAFEYTFEGAYDHDASTGGEFSLTSNLYPNTYYLFSVTGTVAPKAPDASVTVAPPTVTTASQPAQPAQPTITAPVKAQPATIPAQPTKATAQSTTAPTTTAPTTATAQPTATATATAQPAKGSTADTVKSCDIKPGQAWAGYSQYCLGK